MGWIIGTIVIAIVCVIVFIIGRVARNIANRTIDQSKTAVVTQSDKGFARDYQASARDLDDAEILARVGSIVMIVGVVFFSLWMVITTSTRSIHTVEAGHVGLVYQFGDIIGQRNSGAAFTWPWQDFKEATIQVQTLAFVDDKSKVPSGAIWAGEGLDSFDSNSQNIYIDVILRIKVSPENVQSLYRTVGPNYVNKLIPGSIAQVFKDETVNYPAVGIAPAREKIRTSVEENIRKELAPFSITIDALLLENITFDADFEKSILDKQVATQQALKEIELVQAFKAKADQAAEEADGEARRLRVTADGQAYANQKISDSLTPELIQFQFIQKLADNISVMLLPAGGNSLFDVSKLLPQTQATTP